jgi:hypothetical protein
MVLLQKAEKRENRKRARAVKKPILSASELRLTVEAGAETDWTT